MQQEATKEKRELAPPDTTTDCGGCPVQPMVVSRVMEDSPSLSLVVFFGDFSTAACFEC